MSKVNCEELTLTLERGEKGLGFNIKGGRNNPYIPGNDGIFISKIRPEGAAASCGRLKVGDRILEVNGISLENVDHDFAVETFVEAGNTVTLKVIQDSVIHRYVQGSTKKSSSSYRVIIPVTIGALFLGLGMVYLIKRRAST